jgi:Ser-tRNA(Ala) deacylase AlaX
MNIKLKQIIGSLGAFGELQALKFPPKVSLDVYKLGQELDKELAAYKELSQKIYKEHNVPEENGRFKIESLTPEQSNALIQELEELGEADIEIRDYHIPIETIEKIDSNLISPNFIGALSWLIQPDSQKEVSN